MAMSLGGRAGRIAQTIGHNQLWTWWGLPFLILTLETEIGNEFQDRVRGSLTAWSRYQRPNNATAIDHVCNYDILLQEAMTHGLQLNAVGMTHFLLETANLSDTDQNNLLMPFQHNYERYHEIRQSLRRMTISGKKVLEQYPAASSWAPMTQSGLDEQLGGDVKPSLHMGNTLQPPPPDSGDASAGGQNAEEYAYTDGNVYLADLDSDDDWMELDENADEDEDNKTTEIFAMMQKNRKFSRKGKGKGGKSGARSNFRRVAAATGGVKKWPDDPPPGWKYGRDAWLKRTPCPVCNSRLHLDCRNRGGKGGKGGKGSSRSKGVFAFEKFEKIRIKTSDAEELFACLESIDEETRKHLILRAYKTGGRLRYALLVDTGAVENIVGSKWKSGFVKDILTKIGKAKDVKEWQREASFTGISDQEETSNVAVTLPIGMGGEEFEYEGQVLEGTVPGILGLKSMWEKGAIIHLPNQKLYLKLKSGYRGFDLALHNGHLVMLVDQFGDGPAGADLPPQDVFIADECGLKSWVGTENKPIEKKAANDCFMCSDCNANNDFKKNVKETQRIFKATLNIQNTIKNTLTKTMTGNKFKGLSSDTKPPTVEKDPLVQWDVQEFWAGNGKVTKEISNIVLKTGVKVVSGPPVSEEMGWDLHNPEHRKELERLREAHKPKVITWSPDCSIWRAASYANLEATQKAAMRAKEKNTLLWFRDRILKPTLAEGGEHQFSQPVGSPLLDQDFFKEILDSVGGKANLKETDMCAHELRDPENRKPTKKTMKIGASFEVQRCLKACSCEVKHQPLRGNLRNGMSRSVYAQTPTKTFAKRLGLDICAVLNEKAKASGKPIRTTKVVGGLRESKENNDNSAGLVKMPNEDYPRFSNDKQVCDFLSRTLNKWPQNTDTDFMLKDGRWLHKHTEDCERYVTLTNEKGSWEQVTRRITRNAESGEILEDLDVEKFKEHLLWNSGMSWAVPEIFMLDDNLKIEQKDLIEILPAGAPEGEEPFGPHAAEVPGTPPEESPEEEWPPPLPDDYYERMRRGEDPMGGVERPPMGGMVTPPGPAGHPPGLPNPAAPAGVAAPGTPLPEIPRAPPEERHIPEEGVVTEGMRKLAQKQMANFTVLEGEELAAVVSIKAVMPRIGDAGARFVTLGSTRRWELLNAKFAIPESLTLNHAIVMRRPKRLPIAEPMCPREEAPYRLIIALGQEGGEWKKCEWHHLGHLHSTYQHKTLTTHPAWLIGLFARVRQDGDEVIGPGGQRVRGEQPDGEAVTIHRALNVLLTGSESQRKDMVLAIHRRFYHMAGPQLREMLRRAGIPMSLLEMVEDIVKLCDVCRRWAKIGTKPIIRGSLSVRFNQRVYADLVFFEDFVLLMLVDDGIRFTVLCVVKDRTFEALEQGMRRAWISKFGPMQTLTVDSERGLAGEAFGVYCEKLGIIRDLVVAREDHTKLGPIDRRVELLRTMAPKLIDALRSEGVNLEPEDCAAEIEYCMNVQLSHGGVAPYQCLYGALPRPILDCELDTLSSFGEIDDPFYQHQSIRGRSIIQFQEALMQQRMVRALKGRPRKEALQEYEVGMEVDIYREPGRKDLEAWRGPAILRHVRDDGYVQVDWQGSSLDVPVRKVRPHIRVIGITFKTIMTTSKFEDMLDTDQMLNTNEEWYKLMAMSSKMNFGAQMLHVKMLDKAGKVVMSRDSVRDNFGIYNLGRIAIMSLFNVNQYLGLTLWRGRKRIMPLPKVTWSHIIIWPKQFYEEYKMIRLRGDQILDVAMTFGGDWSFEDLNGVVVHEGAFHAEEGTELEKMLQESISAPTKTSTTKDTIMPGDKPAPDDPPYHAEETPLDPAAAKTSRRPMTAEEEAESERPSSSMPSTKDVVKWNESKLEGRLTLPDHDRGRAQASPGASSRGTVGIEAELPSTSSFETAQSGPNTTSDLSAHTAEEPPDKEPEEEPHWEVVPRGRQVTIGDGVLRQRRDRSPRSRRHECDGAGSAVLLTAFLDPVLDLEEDEGPWYSQSGRPEPEAVPRKATSTSAKSCHLAETARFIAYMDADLREGDYLVDIIGESIFSVNRELRPLTAEELLKSHKEVRTAMIKELQSWIDNKAFKPTKRKAYRDSSNLREIPAKWVIEWKEKEGKRVIKARLCMKGFAERNQHRMQTFSPTASRTGHRMVALQAALEKTPLASMDISTAFLKGMTFEELKEMGMERQPCAFEPPEGTLEILQELCGDTFGCTTIDVESWVLELLKGGYGTKDAPLLWNLRAVKCLTKDIGMKPSAYDPMLFYHLEKGKKVLELSLHVDDLLTQGAEVWLLWLRKQLEYHFGKVTYEVDDFKHFGVRVSRDKETYGVIMNQTHYLAQLEPIKIEKTRGDGRNDESLATELEITDYRSVVSGMSWVALTSPLAMSVASLLQAALPKPTMRDLKKVNAALEDLKAKYTPLWLRGDLNLNEVRLLGIGDSSLGNIGGKYTQGGYLIFLVEQDVNSLGGKMILVGYRAAKSKRVARSTLAGETLAMIGMCEEAVYLQEWLHEHAHPELTSWQLIQVADEDFIELTLLTDAENLEQLLTHPAAAMPADRSLMLYLSALREDYGRGRIKHVGWIDTKDMIANGLTKLDEDGTIPSEELPEVLKQGLWQPKFTYKLDGVRYAP